MESLSPQVRNEQVPPVNFPYSVYDQPAFALQNLVRGKAGAAARAMLSPDTLSPEEMQTLRTKFLQTKNPLMQTVVDIGTNPLVWIGAALALKFPVGSAKALYALGRSAAAEVPEMNQWMAGLHGPMAIFRNVEGAWDAIAGVARAHTNFYYDFAKELNDHLSGYVTKTGQQLKPRDNAMLAAYLENWHKAENPLTAQWSKRLGGKGPIIPNLQNHMSGELRSLGDKLRNMLDKAWGRMVPNEAMETEMLAKGVTYQKGYMPRMIATRGFQDWAMSMSGSRREYAAMLDQIVQAGPKNRFLQSRKGYSIPRESDLEHIKDILRPGFMEDLGSITRGSVDELRQQLAEVAMSSLNKTPTFNTEARLSGIIGASVSRHKEMADATLRQLLARRGLNEMGAAKVSRGLLQAVYNPQRFSDMVDELAFKLGDPARYSLMTSDVAETYVKNAATTYAWHTTGLGQKINALPVDGWQKAYLTDDLIPLMRGMKDWKQIVRSARVKDTKFRLWRFVRDNPTINKHVPADTRKWLMDYLGDIKGSMSDVSLGSQMTHYFYLSTLGLNPGAAGKNLLQNFITTAQVLGPKAMAKGMQDLTPRVEKYLSLRTKVGHADAALEAFPEYYSAVGKEGSVVDMLLSEDFSQTGSLAKKAATGVLEKTKKGMMGMFSASEKFNRLWSFYSSRAAAIDGGIPTAQVGDFARDMMMRTQFTGGPTGMPSALVGMWAPMRQYMHFPMRYAGFLHESLRFGQDPSKINLGVLGRTLATSTGIYSAGKNLMGLDLSNALMTGALPSPSIPGTPFYPFPFVPPAVSIAGSVVQAADSGDWSKMGPAVSLMVPGGVAGRRAWKTLAPKYADYNNRQDGGEVPLYNDEGSLVGQMTPWQLTLRAMGMRGNGMEAEQQASKWLLTQREQIRQYRREYLRKLSENDVEGAEKVNQDFAARYPSLGKIELKKADIKAMENRRQISRVNRILKGFPKEYQPLFSYMTNQAAMGSIANDLEQAPTGLEQYLQ